MLGNFHFAHIHDIMEQVRQSTLKEERPAIVEALKSPSSHILFHLHRFKEQYLMHEK